MSRDALAIRTATDDPESRATVEQLQRLLSTYDLSKWIFTTEVVIDRRAIPHSHPVLTLHTRHLGHDELLLATFVHEQLHWFLMAQPEAAVEAAFRDVRTRFPSVPVGAPDGGHDEESSYLHLIVNYLEWEALGEIIGESAARRVVEFWAQDHYRWIYRAVLERGDDIRAILSDHGLLEVTRAG